MNLDKFVPPTQQVNAKFPLGLCECGIQTRYRKKGKPFCCVCDVDAKRAADRAKGIPFQPFKLPPAGMTGESTRSRETSNN